MSFLITSEAVRKLRREIDDIINVSRKTDSSDMTQVELSCVRMKKMLWEFENMPQSNTDHSNEKLIEILENTVRVSLTEKGIKVSKKRINDITDEFYKFICDSITEVNDLPYRVEFYEFAKEQYGSIANMNYAGNRNLKMSQQNDIPPEVRRNRDEGQDSE